MKRVVLIGLIAGLVACSSANVQDDFAFDPAGGEGLVVGSITQDKKSGTVRMIANIHLEKVGASNAQPGGIKIASREKDLASYLPVLKKSDYADVTGRLFAQKLSPGSYEIKYWHVLNGQGQNISPASYPQALRFRVNPGEILFIGNVHFNFDTSDNYLGLSAPVRVSPEIKDETRRDIALMRKKFPQLKDRPVVPGLLSLGPWRSAAAAKAK